MRSIVMYAPCRSSTSALAVDLVVHLRPLTGAYPARESRWAIAQFFRAGRSISAVRRCLSAVVARPRPAALTPPVVAATPGRAGHRPVDTPRPRYPRRDDMAAAGRCGLCGGGAARSLARPRLLLGLVAGIGAGRLSACSRSPATPARPSTATSGPWVSRTSPPRSAHPGVSGSGTSQAAACLTHDPVAELHALQATRWSWPWLVLLTARRTWRQAGSPCAPWVRYDGSACTSTHGSSGAAPPHDDAADEAEVSEFLAGAAPPPSRVQL